MDEILKAYALKKQTLEKYINGLWNNALKNRRITSSMKSNYKMALNKFYNEQMKILDNERRRLIHALTSSSTTTLPLPIVPSKKACLVGINYQGTSAELRGCVNDVYILRDLLVSQYKYKPENIVVLTDHHATRENILREFTSLVQQAKSGDSICFSFSGHGFYQKDANNDEADGNDELIVTVDNYGISDDEFKVILDTHLTSGVNMFAIFDSCHSGTVLDLKYSFDNNIIATVNESFNETKGNVILLSGCRDNQESSEAYLNNSFQGALSAAFVLSMRNNLTMTWNELLVNMREIMVFNHFDQVPQISSGKSGPLSGVQVTI
jgi:hypothetical protein